MSDLLEEADIDYVYQKRIQLFKKLLPLIVLVTLLSILVVSFKDWYYDREAKKQESRTNLLIEALTEKIDKSLKEEILNSLSKQNDGVGTLAKFALIDKKDKSKTLEILDTIIQNSSDQVSKNLARLEYAGILLDSETLNKEQIDKLQSLLVQIDKTQPLFVNAQIYTSLLNIKVDNLSKAKEIALKLLEEEKLPDSIRSQAESVISYINEKESK